MDAKPTSINQILYLPETYVIPVFQRYYEWQDDQWEQLWLDIYSMLENRAEPLNHFIGPFVFISHSSPSSALHLIIDGQQRLITISLIFAALRDLAKQNNLTSLSELLDQYLFSKDADGSLQMKLVTRVLDRDTFKNILHGDHSRIDKASKIFKSYNFFKSKIEDLLNSSETDQFSVLKDIKDTITGQLQLVEITLNPNDNPSNIYQSLNFKGKKLADADLARNYVFMKLPINDQEKFESSSWRKFEDLFLVEQQVDTEKIEDFYYRFLILKTGYFARKSLYSEFTKFVDKFLSEGSSKFSKLEELVILFREFAEYYINIVDQQETDNDILKILKKIEKLSVVDTATPFILSLYYRYQNGSAEVPISKAELIAFLQNLESFVIRRSFLRLRTRGYGLDFAEAIKKSLTLDDLIKYFISKNWPTDQEVRDSLHLFKIYVHEKKKANLILSEIERALGHKEKADLEEVTIEHILPQALTDDWRSMLGDDPETIHEKYVHTIGNLTLTGYNDDLGNLPFNEKKEIFRESKLSINKYFDKFDEWNEKLILNRTDWITKHINRIWPRPKG